MSFPSVVCRVVDLFVWRLDLVDWASSYLVWRLLILLMPALSCLVRGREMLLGILVRFMKYINAENGTCMMDLEWLE